MLQRRIVSMLSKQETYPDVVTGMLKVFSMDVYSLLNLDSTLYFIAPLIAEKFEIFPHILNESFMVSTPMGESVVAKRLYRNCSIVFPNRVSHVELVELYMFEFDVIFGLYWLHACFAVIYYITMVVKFNFLNEPVLEWKKGNSIPRGRISSCFKDCKSISKGYVYHIVKVQNLDSGIPLIESVPIMREFSEVFPNDLPGFHMNRKLILVSTC